MAWSGGQFTRANGDTGWVDDAAMLIGIEAGRHDTQDNDFKTGINATLTKDGTNTPTANLPMNTHRHTGVGAAVATTDYARFDQVISQTQNSTTTWGGTSGGTANAQTLTLTPAITAYVAGQSFRFIAGFTSTGALTLQINGIASPVTCLSAETKLGIGTYSNLIAGLTYEALYNGTNFLLTTFSEFVGYTNDTNGAFVHLSKSRSTTAGTNTIVQNGDSLGSIAFYGANGTGFTRGAHITAAVDGTPGASNDMPTTLVFATTPDGSGSTLERMRITPAGRVGIGGTPTSSLSTIVNNESAALRVLDLNSNMAGDLTNHALFIGKKDNDTTTSQAFIGFVINGFASGSGQINANGANAAAFGAYSDARLKENVTDLPSQLEAMCSLRPVEFDYKDGSGHQLGFIAQEVQEIYPDLVGEGANGFLTLSDLNKNDARMIKAFQELCCKVEALEARLAVLEAV